MTEMNETPIDRDRARHKIEVSDETLAFRSVSIDDLTPTGAQLAAAAGFKPAQNVVVLQFLPNGELEDIRDTEVVDLRHSEGRFIIVETDAIYPMTIDGQDFQWPAAIITGATLRKLGGVPTEKDFYLERVDEPDRLIGATDTVNLSKKGVESFLSREKQKWKLQVQDVVLVFDEDHVKVRDAMVKAGYDPDKPYIITLKTSAGKEDVTVDYIVDLTLPGIEKIRLTPGGINNGEAQNALRHQFNLLPVDDRFLNSLGLPWETIIDNGTRWLLIYGYRVPEGYSAAEITLAIQVPTGYPAAEIDMFFTLPKLLLRSGAAIRQTEGNAVIAGTTYSRWSRHRTPIAPWNPATDNIQSHLALVSGALEKDVGA
jgi:hypothetical protein